MRYLDRHLELLREIDQTYDHLRRRYSEKTKSHSELESYWAHFYHVWMKICEQQGFASPHPEKTIKAKIKDFINHRILPTKRVSATPQEMSAVFTTPTGFSLAPELMEYKTAYGFKMVSTGQDMWHILATGHYSAEYAETWLLLKLAQVADVFVDIGANIGFFSNLLAHENQHLKIFAFEPSSENRRRLTANVELNKKTAQIKTLPYALGAKPGVMALNLCPIGSGGHTLTAVQGPKTEEVVTETFDGLVARKEITTARMTVIKIDVEGFEHEVILGAQQFLNSENPPVILFEAWPNAKSTYKEPHLQINRFLWNHGYETFGIAPFKHGTRPLYSVTGKSKFTLPATGNYLAIPQKGVASLLETLNASVDARVFSTSDRLENILSFLKLSLEKIESYLS